MYRSVKILTILLGLLACLAIVGLPLPLSHGESQMMHRDSPTASSNKLDAASTCFKGRASSGKRPGVINVRVFCRSRKRNDLQFSVNVYSRPQRNRHSLLQNFRRRPVVSGPHHLQEFGICRESSHTLDCRAVAKGSVRIQGRLWVKPNVRCQAEVRIFVARPAECHSRECEGVFRVRYLYKGRPRGC